MEFSGLASCMRLAGTLQNAVNARIYDVKVKTEE